MESSKNISLTEEHIDLENIICWYTLQDNPQLHRCSLAALPSEKLTLLHAINRSYLGFASESNSKKVA